MEETRGHPYQLRSSKSDTKTSAINASRPNKKPKLTDGLQGKRKAQRDKPQASNVSSQPKLNIGLQGEDKAQRDEPRGIISGREEVKRRVPTGAELERHRQRMRGFANKALGWLQSIGGPEYRVVKVLKHSLGNRPHGLLRHLNFDAQRQGDPNAPVELFFAEFLSTKGNSDAVEICRPLGHSDVMKQTYADTRGCDICHPNTVYHPPKGHFGIKGDD